MHIGLLDVDSHNGFPNFALLRLAAYHRAKGDTVEWADAMFGSYDRVYQSKIFTFTPDYPDYDWGDGCEVIRGGTGYDISSRLPAEIESSTGMDYSIYPDLDYSVQFFSRGCIRKCPFCIVREKEGYITPVEPVDLNPRGKCIEVLDNNFFANPEWRTAIDYLLKAKQKVNLHGVDIRIMDEEQAHYLNKLRMDRAVHIAWDIPTLDLTDKFREVTKYINPRKLMCYVLVDFNSTPEQDLYRIERCREYGIMPFVMPYRNYDNPRPPSQYAKDLAHWCNRKVYFKSPTFADFEPRKGFLCKEYLK